MPIVLLVRHAQASFGAARYDELSPLGHRQAARLATALAGRRDGPVRLCCGSLRRQRETAEALLRAGAGARLEVDPRWDEYDSAAVMAHHGPGEAAGSSEIGAPPGMGNAEFQRALDAALEAWIESGPSSPCVETWPMFCDRVLAALNDLVAGLRPGGSAVAVTSGGVTAAVLAALLSGGPQGFVSLNRTTVNTAVATILCGRRGLHVAAFGEHAHLGGDRGLMSFR